jgi:hypothetical protein
MAAMRNLVAAYEIFEEIVGWSALPAKWPGFVIEISSAFILHT